VADADQIGLLSAIYRDDPWPKPVHILQGLERIKAGADPQTVTRALRTSPQAITAAAEASDPVVYLLGISPAEIEDSKRHRIAQTLGQLLVGRCAEMAFENLYRSEMGTQELELRDLRESRSDTDYRVVNGSGRPLYRLNIKFHGSQFRRAAEMVGLEPHDCFALATYKIHGALRKQEQEHLPYIFAIVGVPALTGLSVGQAIPIEVLGPATFLLSSPRLEGKRDFEDRVIQFLVSTMPPVFRETYDKIEQAAWYILSARRADRLLREKLFERVFALRIPGFARQFRRAELDMHFSLSTDLTPLKEFFATLREGGTTKVASMLERGSI
jgi:hypothetical protein